MVLNYRWLSFFGGIMMIVLFACTKKKDCAAYASETYTARKVDSAELLRAMKKRDKLLRQFDETSISKVNYACYHLLYYSSFGQGRSIKLEKNNGHYSLTLKCISDDGKFPDCQNIQLEMFEQEWVDFENLLSEFNFWQVDQLDDRKDKDDYDKSMFVLEGNRPEAADCGKKSYQFVARHHIGYDNTDALCLRIIKFQQDLVALRRNW